MASGSNPPDSPQGDGGMSPGKRKRLQQCFEHANKLMAHESYDFDYVTDLFSQCVLGDPGNFVYTQSYLANLKRKYNNNKKGVNLAFIKGAGSRAMVKKAAMHKDWPAVIKAGVEALKLNPWDSSTLLNMANAADALEYPEVQMVYLKAAMDGSPKDPEVLRSCAEALAKRKRFDEAIHLWHRVEEIRPGDEEAARAIATLAVEKTLHVGGFEDKDKDPSKMKFAKEGQKQLEGAVADAADIEKLEKAIAKKPNELSNYLALADLLLREEQFARAEQVLADAFEVSDGNVDVREKWEDTQLRNLHQQLKVAEKEAKKGDAQAQAKFKDLRRQVARKELEVYKHRCERYPTNLSYKYELGLRYKLNGQYNEAIKELQQAKNDPRRKGACLLQLGHCFCQVNQPRLAANSYATAVEEIPDRDDANKKTALYHAGKLAISLKHLDTAQRYLNRLAEMDFSYKDVSSLLEQVAKMRAEGQNEEPPDQASK